MRNRKRFFTCSKRCCCSGCYYFDYVEVIKLPFFYSLSAVDKLIPVFRRFKSCLLTPKKPFFFHFISLCSLFNANLSHRVLFIFIDSGSQNSMFVFLEINFVLFILIFKGFSYTELLGVLDLRKKTKARFSCVILRPKTGKSRCYVRC